jgi:rSAM/selenodomain-associated transferase 2
VSRRISAVIPTLNEAARIAGTIAAARAALGLDAEIIVVDGGSTDGTIERAAAAGARVLGSPRGRGVQLRAGAAMATGDTIVMLHADTRLPQGARRAIEAAFADPAVAGGAFSLAFEEEGGSLPPALRVYARWLSLRSRLFGIACGDQAIFARADVLHAAGGVPALPLFEDVRVYRALRRGGRLRLLRATVTTSPRLFLHAGPLRVIGLHFAFRMLHALGVPPATLARWYPASGPAEPAAD